MASVCGVVVALVNVVVVPVVDSVNVLVVPAVAPVEIVAVPSVLIMLPNYRFLNSTLLKITTS